MAWLDNTGLYQKYGTEQTVPNNDGEYKTFGELRDIELVINLKDLTETETILSDVVFFPKGMKIERLDVFVDEAAATGVAVDLGFIKADRSTELDYNGLLAAMPTGTLTLGAHLELVKGSSNVGALVGDTTTEVAYVSASRTTSTAFTAGKIRVRIKYSKA